MTPEMPDSDWKLFRELSEVALERFCRRALEEIVPICSDGSRSGHERYLEVFRVMQERDDQLGRAFDGPRRSQMLFQLAAIHALGLVEPTELARSLHSGHA